MKLIEKDALEEAVQGAINIMESHGISMIAASVPLAIIKGAPTIDAIPVKWMEQRRFETSFHGAEPDIDLNYAFCTVMNEWQKEQEAR